MGLLRRAAVVRSSYGGDVACSSYQGKIEATLARIYLRSLPKYADDIWREAVAFVCIHPPILAIFGKFTWQYLPVP
jgi:hypothetical protein